MDVNNVMNTYTMNSVWNSINPLNSSSSSVVPLLSNIDSTVEENNTAAQYFGQTTNTELQDIYEHIEPDYGIPLTYDQNGNFAMPSATSSPSAELTAGNSNILSLLNSGSSTADSLTQGVLSEYNAIENGTYTPDISTILSTNPYNTYNTINTLGNSQAQNLTSSIDEFV